MILLSHFRWYRRMRGGYWAQVSAPLGIGMLSLGFVNRKWIRCKDRWQPKADGVWEFYPWASKTMSNCYTDEWHEVEPYYLVPYSQWISATLGTNDMACVLRLIS